MKDIQANLLDNQFNQGVADDSQARASHERINEIFKEGKNTLTQSEAKGLEGLEAPSDLSSVGSLPASNGFVKQSVFNHLIHFFESTKLKTWQKITIIKNFSPEYIREFCEHLRDYSIDTYNCEDNFVFNLKNYAQFQQEFFPEVFAKQVLRENEDKQATAVASANQPEREEKDTAVKKRALDVPATREVDAERIDSSDDQDEELQNKIKSLGQQVQARYLWWLFSESQPFLYSNAFSQFFDWCGRKLALYTAGEYEYLFGRGKEFSSGGIVSYSVRFIIKAVRLGPSFLGFALRALAYCIGRPYKHRSKIRRNHITVSSFADKPIAANKQKNVNIMTYNIACLPTPLGHQFNADFLHPNRLRAKAIAEKIIEENTGLLDNCPDVICFQEAFDTNTNKMLINMLKAHYPHIAHNIGVGTFNGGSGLIVFSKYPILDVDFVAYNNGMLGEETVANKGFAGLKFKLNDKEFFTHYTTHTHGGGGIFKNLSEKYGGTTSQRRGVQFGMLHQHREKWAKLPPASAPQLAHKATVISGDTNMSLNTERQMLSKSTGRSSKTEYKAGQTKYQGQFDLFNSIKGVNGHSLGSDQKDSGRHIDSADQHHCSALPKNYASVRDLVKYVKDPASKKGFRVIGDGLHENSAMEMVALQQDGQDGEESKSEKVGKLVNADKLLQAAQEQKFTGTAIKPDFLKATKLNASSGSDLWSPVPSTETVKHKLIDFMGVVKGSDAKIETEIDGSFGNASDHFALRGRLAL